LRNYALLFYVTDGSLFYPSAKRNILIIQSPAHIPIKTTANRLKMKGWDSIFCYSNYVKKHILRIWGKEIVVLPPAVNVADFKPLTKENLILSVGRFSQSLHRKKQEVLIEAFKKIDKSLNLKLVLAGGMLGNDREYFEKLKKQAEGFEIDIFPNIEFSKLGILYGKAKIYWHGAGYGEDLRKDPEKAEHFGITTVEAMASGCVAIVFGAGGQEEIISEGKDGFFWQTEDELVKKTEEVISGYEKYQGVIDKARKKSRDFDRVNFGKRLSKILCL